MRPISSLTADERESVFGSRPAFSQAASTRNIRVFNCSRSLFVCENQVFQPSAYFAVSASMRLLAVPIMMGGPSGRGPRGRSSQSRIWYHRPSKSQWLVRSSEVRIAIPS